MYKQCITPTMCQVLGGLLVLKGSDLHVRVGLMLSVKVDNREPQVQCFVGGLQTDGAILTAMLLLLLGDGTTMAGNSRGQPLAQVDNSMTPGVRPTIDIREMPIRGGLIIKLSLQ